METSAQILSLGEIMWTWNFSTLPIFSHIFSLFSQDYTSVAPLFSLYLPDCFNGDLLLALDVIVSDIALDVVYKVVIKAVFKLILQVTVPWNLNSDILAGSFKFQKS